jgi:NADH dehydrogenase
MGKKQIVIVGGGFGGVYTYLNLLKKIDKSKIELTLVNKNNYFLFTPLLHEVATGSVNQSNIIQPLREILKPGTGKILEDEVLSINPGAQIVVTAKNKIKYDFLVLAAGAKTNFFSFQSDLAFGLKDLADARRLKNHLVECLEKAEWEEDFEERQKLLTFVVIGGGPTGVELVAEVAEFVSETLVKSFKSLKKQDIKIYLVQKSSKLLPNFDSILAEKAANFLSNKVGLEILFNCEVLEIFKDKVVLKNGNILKSYTAILSAGIKPNYFDLGEAVKLNKKGQILTNPFLQIAALPNIFVVGDMAAIDCEKNSIPQTAQAAEAGASVVAKNIQALLNSQPLTSFFYKEKGQLVSLGRWMAIAQIYRIKLFGHFAWWVWRTIYASKLIGWANRLRVVLDWTIDIFYPRDISKF